MHVGAQQFTGAVVARGIGSSDHGALAWRHPRSIRTGRTVAPLIHDMLEGRRFRSSERSFRLCSLRGAASPTNATRFLRGGGEMVAAYLETSRSEIT